MTRRQRLLGVYARTGRTYRAWAPHLLGLAAVVFVPLGLLNALLNEVDPSSLNVTEGFKVAAFLGAAGAVAASGLFGEVFFSGAISTVLTHPEEEEPPRLREIAGKISYARLIAVDVIYVVLAVVGLALLVVPMLLVVVYFSAAGAVVELERRGVRDSFVRSFRLVRGHFWMVAAVVIPIEVVGDLVNDALVDGVHALLGHGFLPAWLGEAVGNVVTAPFFSVAVVLLTVDLIDHREGNAPVVKRRPAAIPAGGPA